MKRLFLTAVSLFLCAPEVFSTDWPSWRGPKGDGTSPDVGFITEWGPEKNVRWKVALPGAGNASPVIHGQDVILAASSNRDHSDLHLLCYDRQSGKKRWQTNFTATPADAPFSMFPPERGHAASTPVVSADAIYNLFGSGDLIAVDRAGQPLWARSLTQEFGPFRNDYGIASSPLLAGTSLIVQIDHLQGSYILAVDARTGKTRWKTPRPTAYDNWSTPVLATVQGKQQVITLGTKKVIAYDLADGKEAWSLDGLERLCSCTPVLQDNRLYAVSGPNGATLAIDLAASPTPKIIWQSKKTGPFIPSPLVTANHYFLLNDQGLLACHDINTGEEKWKERVANGRMRPSPVAADGKIFITGLDGSTTVIAASAEYQVLAKNTLGEDVAASLALSDGQIFIRSDKHLWCFAAKK